jgi:hypothetical protein
MPRGILDRDRAALRHPHDGEALEAGRLDDRFEVADSGIQAVVGDARVGQAVAALVVPHDGGELSDVAQEVLPDRALPVELEMAEPARRDDEWWSGAAARPGDARAVGGAAEAQLLLNTRARRRDHGTMVAP